MILVIDLTIVSVGLPAIQRDLGGSLASLQWVVISYAVAFGALMQPIGSLSDRLGRREMFLAGIAVFTLASLACGLAPTSLFLDIARALQGVGGAMLFANALPLIAQDYEGQRRNMAIAKWSTMLGACGAAAPLVGGVLVDVADWRWMFLINVPIGALGFALAWFKLPKVDRVPPTGPIDWFGVVLFTGSLAVINLAVTRGEEQGWGSPTTLAQIAGGVVLLVVFLLVERRASAPIMRLELFRIPSFVGAVLLSFLSRALTLGTAIYFVLYLQAALGLSALESGLALLPIYLAALPGGMGAGKLQARFAAGHIIAVGFGMLAVSAALFSWLIQPGGDVWPLIAPMILWGLGSGLSTTPLMGVAVNVVPLERAGMASGMANSLFPIGTAVGTAAFGLAFKAAAGDSVQADTGVPEGSRDTIAQATAEGDLQRIAEATPAGAGDQVSNAVESAIAHGTSQMTVYAAVVAAVAVVIALVLIRRRDVVARTPAAAPPEDGAEDGAEKVEKAE
ncbi:MFS transporter [Saccharothrix xinjiangensis]|uniref:MFS transporter n=1 Tax=Saccharothrix xinjiangensis TaxID=204798 RepID=A0ABV9Y5Z5_9PSEU